MINENDEPQPQTPYSPIQSQLTSNQNNNSNAMTSRFGRFIKLP